jgi:hypothetical protein
MFCWLSIDGTAISRIGRYWTVSRVSGKADILKSLDNNKHHPFALFSSHRDASENYGSLSPLIRSALTWFYGWCMLTVGRLGHLVRGTRDDINAILNGTDTSPHSYYTVWCLNICLVVLGV